MTNIKLVPLEAIQDERPAKALGAWVLNQVEAYIGRFVAYPSEHARVAHTLWIAHAHLMDCWEFELRASPSIQRSGVREKLAPLR